MSKKMLSRKLGADEGLGPESATIVTETNKEKREGLTLNFLIAGGIVILLVASLVLMPYVNSLGGNIFSGLSSTTDSSNDAVQATTALAASFKATDGKGTVIEENGVTKSAEMTITGYSGDSYSTELSCLIDGSQHVYCSGSDPVSLLGLPPGEHTFTVLEPRSDEITASSFGWEISE
jgi:hypothetical protein